MAAAMKQVYYDLAKQHFSTCDTLRANGRPGSSSAQTGDDGISGTAQALAVLVLAHDASSVSAAELSAAIDGLEQLHAEVREVLDQERLTASVNYQRLMCLLRTVLGGAPAKQRPQMNVSRLIDRLLGREAKEPQQEAPMDTPHRHLATAMKEMQDTVTYLETLNLSHEHTAIVNVTEVTRQNLLAVVQDVRDFVELPDEMHDMIRGMAYDPQNLEAYPPVASRVVAHMLRVAPSCAVSAALVHMAHRQQVASLTITETYLADFRLVWRCVVAHLRNVFDNTWMLAQISPAVVVDAVRAARLLDSVVNETLQANTAKQLGPTANVATLHCDILVLGCDELYILDTVPDELRGDLEQVLSALHDAVGKHSGVLGGVEIEGSHTSGSVDGAAPMTRPASQGTTLWHSSACTSPTHSSCSGGPTAAAEDDASGEPGGEGLFSEAVPECIEATTPVFSPAGDSEPAVNCNVSVFERFCRHTFAVSMRVHVESVVHFDGEPLASETSSISFMRTTASEPADDVPEAAEEHAQQVLGIVERLEEFLAGAGDGMPTCFPPDWPLLDWVFEPCRATLLEIAYAAAADEARVWSFKAYMQLEASVRACLATATRIGVGARGIQDVEAAMQLVYTAMGKLGQQFLMSAVESATGEGAAMLRVAPDGPEPTLPDCIEVLRMMYQQVMMAAKSGTWPLLHLVSIGCHVAVSELLQRLAATFRPAAPGGAAGDEASKPRAKGSPAWGAAASHAAAPCEGDSVFAIKVRALLESGALSRLQHASSDALDASQCIKAHLSRSLSRSLTTSRSRVRSFQDAARLVSSTSQLTQRPKRPVAAKASSHEVAACCAAAQHEYPVLAIAATANTMMHMVDECGEISEQITSYLPACLPHAASAGASDGNDEGRDASLPGPFSGQDERRSGRAGEGGELSMAITQQHESWRQLGQQAAALADLCVHTLLSLTVRDSVDVLAGLFSERWMDSAGRLSTDSGLNTALLTCQDYVEEVAWAAQPRVYGMFQRCLLRHLACCVAARMLCSAHPYDHAWQKGVAVEIQRIRSFAQRIERADHEAAETYLGMLSLLRTLLCAPDAFSVSAAYNTMVTRFGILDVALLEAALRKHSHEGDDGMVSEAMSQCAEIMAMELAAEEDDGAADAVRRATMATVAWRTAAGVTDSVGRQPTLMAYVEALLEAGRVHYTIPRDVLGALDLLR